MVGKAATTLRASSRSSPSGDPSVPAAILSASIAGTRSAAAAPKRALVASGNALRAARSPFSLASCPASGSASFQRRYSVSSKVARPASSSTGKPAITRSPASPSTMLSRVIVATTPSSPCTDGPVVLPFISSVTSRVLLGALVCNPRQPPDQGRRNNQLDNKQHQDGREGSRVHTCLSSMLLSLEPCLL